MVGRDSQLMSGCYRVGTGLDSTTKYGVGSWVRVESVGLGLDWIFFLDAL